MATMTTKTIAIMIICSLFVAISFAVLNATNVMAAVLFTALIAFYINKNK